MPVENAERRLAQNPEDVRNNNSPTTPRRLKTAERRQYVVALRTAGATLEQCAIQAARKFGEENLPKHYLEDTRIVWRDIQRALEQAYENIRQDWTAYRMIQMDRYESVIRAHWPKAMAGHLGATDRVLKAMKDESKLLGLEAPQQVDMRVMQIDSRIEDLMERVASRREAEVAGALGAGGGEAEDSVVEGTARHL